MIWFIDLDRILHFNSYAGYYTGIINSHFGDFSEQYSYIFQNDNKLRFEIWNEN